MQQQNQSSSQTTASSSQDIKIDYNLFPIHEHLLNHVRTLDGLNDKDILKLKSLLSQITSTVFNQPLTLEKKDFSDSGDLLTYIQTLLKLHQVFALLDVDFSKVNDQKKQHAQDILDAFQQGGGLNYVPRQRTIQGRSLEHASDTTSLINYLIQLETQTLPDTIEIEKISKPIFFVSTTDSKREINEFVLNLQKQYVELTLTANGKAELYFHAYVWTTYTNALSSELPEILQCPQIKRLVGLSLKPKQVIDQIKKFPFGEQEYQKVMLEYASLKPNTRQKMIEYIQGSLFVAQITNNKASLYLIEKILIQLLGYPDINSRDNAVVLLNTLYDGTDWQLQTAFRPVIRCIGQHFKVSLTINVQNFDQTKSQLFLGLSAPSPLKGINDTVMTWHQIQTRNIVKSTEQETEILINFGKFWKCGFYDWKLMLMSENGKLDKVMLTKPPTLHNFPMSGGTQSHQDNYDYDYDEYDMDILIAQGRYIVQPKGIKDETFHEVKIDYQNSQVDYSSKTFTKRGTFQDVEKSLKDYNETGVSVLYLMGVFERDNCPVKGSAGEAYYNKNHSMLKKENASAFAVTDRQTPCEMLGGQKGFESLVSQAKKQKIKIVVDSLARISSSRHHRKFRDLLLHYLDQEGRRHICYGTDGQAIKYEETAILNYRKIEAWNLLIEEIESFTTKYGIDGIHLDNGQAWPQIFEPDIEELTRIDVDGQPAYTAQQLMDGEIVNRNENYGYWNTNLMEQYANPFFVKLCKILWSKFPNFMILGECWGGHKFEHRQIILARSGIIPRLFKLPATICSLLGKKLHSDGRVSQSEKSDSLIALKNWYDDSHLHVPEGSIMLQSSTAHSWPYPAYLYGKGAWAAVDILYFMPDIPITFNAEVDGQIHRLDFASLHQAEKEPIKSESTGLKKQKSQVKLALEEVNQDQTKDPVILTQQSSENSGNQKQKNMPRIRSGQNLASMLAENQSISEKETHLRNEMGQDMGYDLNKIKTHYASRRYLRQQKMVLRYGELCSLAAKDPESNRNDPRGNWSQDILTFARYSLMETAIVAINISEQQKSFYVDLQPLYKLFSKTLNDNTVIVTSSLLPAKNQVQSVQEYYLLREFMSIKHIQTLIPYSTSIQIINVCPNDKQTFQFALTRSIERTREKLINGKDIEAEQISQLLIDCLQQRSSDAAYFAGLIGGLKENLLDKMNISLLQLIKQNSRIKDDQKLFAQFSALCQNIAQTSIKPSIDCKNVLLQNKLGPIVFCTPELGRWSTVGGLGVMVDELSIGLAQLGQEVIVISPYYDRNRKGQTGYLLQDPAKIEYVDNIHVSLDTLYTLGVHEGIVSGVRVVFLHQSEIFPIPYADADAQMTTRQISIFSKACLEYCCQRNLTPSICVTNDWFTGFVPAYAKVGVFGQYFQQSTFIHICHNLNEDYEGRIYPDLKDGYLQHIHQLPIDWLVDPLWNKIMINPSRTAIIMSDQWSTVSKSYRDDLLNHSPLNHFLRQKSQPFAHPNGIPISDRIKKLDAVAPNHLAAKKLIQKKYFNLPDLNDQIPLFAFVGRITTQKGVHLILEIVEQITDQYKGQVQFLVGGPANMRDPYSAMCANRMWQLKARYPNSFWAAPEEFFTDGALVNRGADFGLMPSLFEPGGIVQHEFFVGGTPVVAFKTGGLKDSVIEFQSNSEIGCGFTFESYCKEDFIFAMQRAIGIYNNKSKYSRLRENAFKATMPGETVSIAWLAEFYRLRNKIYLDYNEFKESQDKIKQWKEEDYQPLNIFDTMFGKELRQEYELDDIDFGAEESKDLTNISESKSVESAFDKVQRQLVSVTFGLHNWGPRHKGVEICGSFDNWDKRHKMQFDPITNQWFISLQLYKGEHLYKYVIETNENTQYWVVNDEERQCRDKLGNTNNFINI